MREPRFSTLLFVVTALCVSLAGVRASAQAQNHHKSPTKPKTSGGRGYDAPQPDAVPSKGAADDAVPSATPEPSAPTSVSTSPASEPSSTPATSAPQAAKDSAPKEAAPPAVDPNLQQDLAQIMDDLVQARARVAVLGKSLFKTRVRVKIDNRAAPDQVAVRIALWLDGAPIWTGDGAAVRSAARVLFDGFAAPGPHSLTAEVEQRARDNEAYRYTLRESYRFMVVREKRTDLVLVLDDDSDMAEDFPDDQEGEYDVRTRLKVHAVGLNEE